MRAFSEIGDIHFRSESPMVVDVLYPDTSPAVWAFSATIGDGCSDTDPSTWGIGLLKPDIRSMTLLDPPGESIAGF